jgi:5-methylcytosine-specific restriction endonuclease McrA
MQVVLFCGCGCDEFNRQGLCEQCARRARLSKENFDGLREAALRRDSYQCQACGELDPTRIVVHHRKPGTNELRHLITLCRRCHAKIHRTWRPPFGFLDFLRRLWREANADLAEQRLLALLGDVPRGEQTALFDRGADF